MSCLYEDGAKDRKTGRTDEQKKVLDYFYGRGGCIGSIINLINKMKDDQYMALIQEKVKQINSMETALNKLGIDESMVQEVKPLYLEGFTFQDSKSIAKETKAGGEWVSSDYEITWVFCGDKQIYVYSHRFSMIDDRKKITAEEYFYKDVTNITHTSETVEKETYHFTCVKTKNVPKSATYNSFLLSAMGDKLYCAMDANEETERAIQGLKNKLREKKNA